MKRISAPLRLIGTSTRHAGDLFQLLGGKIEAVLEAVGLDAQVIAGAEAVGGRLQHPIDVASEQVQQLAADHGDLSRVDAVGAEDRAAPAFRALVKVVEPFLDDVFGQLAPARQRAEDAARQGEIAPVNRADQLGAQHRHIFGIAGADIEVALVGAGSAAHADIHEQPEGAILVEPLLHAVEDDLFPIRRQLPVGIEGLPLAWIGQAEVIEILRQRAVTDHSLAELDTGVAPVALRGFLFNLQ